MADFPAPLLAPCSRVTNAAADLAGASSSVAITTGAVSNTKGAWTQLTASTPFAASGLLVRLERGAVTNYAVDLGVGGSGSETALVSNMLLKGVTNFIGYADYLLPLAIPFGTRLSARAASVTTSQPIRIGAYLFAGGFPAGSVGSAVDVYGNPGTISTVTVVASASANTKGSWSQITAATTAASRWCCLAFDCQNNTPTSNVGRLLFDLGLGASGSEQVVLADMALTIDYSNVAAVPQSVCLPLALPAGVRVAGRLSTSEAGAVTSNKTLGVTLHLVR